MTENEIGKVIITAAMTVHSALGPGLLESAYELCLAHELKKREMKVRNQVSIPIRYDDLVLDNGYRIDLLVNDRVVLARAKSDRNRPARPSRSGIELSAARWVQAGLLAQFQRRAYARRHHAPRERPLKRPLRCLCVLCDKFSC